MKTLSVICVFVFSLTAFGQTDRGTITGTVSDATGAVIPGAAIEAKNVATGAVYQAGSSETGNYTLAQLPAGTYEVSVNLPGFRKFVRAGIIVEVARILRIDATLQVGTATEAVTVEAESPLLKTESGEISQNIATDQLNNLPVVTLPGLGGLGNIRNPLQAVTLLPGASFYNDNTLRINGMPSSSQAIRVEGQDATNGMWRQQNQVTQAGIDAIQEVAVQTSNYAAEYGQAGGGYFNYTMKSGTNQFHGSAYDYLVNEFLNAGIPFTDRATITNDPAKAGQHIRNTQRKNDYGFTVGGPIVLGKFYNGHDKTFFFFSFEQYRESQFITNGIATVPTLAYRRGDFSGALIPCLPSDPACLSNGVRGLTIGGVLARDPLGRFVPQNAIYDPRTTRLAPDGSRIRDPFPNNVIPPEMMDPVALRVQAMLPVPTNNDLINNYSIPGYVNFRHTTIPSFKIDHNFSAKKRLAWYFSQTHTVSPATNGFTQDFTAVMPQDDVSYTMRLNYDQTLSRTMLFHAGAGLLDTTHPALPKTFDQSTLGWAKNFYVNQFPYLSGLQNVAVGGVSLVGATGSLGTNFSVEYLKDIKPTGNASVTVVKGNHTIKAGGDLIFEGFPQLNYSRANGIFGFSAQQSSLPWEDGRGLNGTTGFPYASFLMGYTNSLSISAVTNSRLGNHSLAAYVQDSWKVTRRLTLDYGLRYDFVTLLREQYGRMQSAAFNLPNPAAGGRLGTVIYEATCKCQFNRNYPWALGPRVGLAYQINSKTVLRAGSGVIYGSAPNNAFLSYSVPDFYTFGAPGYGLPASLLSDGNPYGPGNRFGNPPIFWPDFNPHYPSEVAPGIRPPQSPFISIDRNAGRPPRQIHWSLGLQREITPNLMVEAAYVGNRGVWWTAPLLAAQNYNSLTPEALKATWGLDITNAADRNLLTLPINSPPVLARFPGLRNPDSVYPGFPANQPLIQALRPHPQWNGVPPFLGPPLGNTWYDSLQAKVVQRLSHGLTVQGTYTWQKELALGLNSDTSYVTPSPFLINDVFNRNQNKQLSGFSRPQMLSIAFSYTTPAWSKFKALSWFVRDWTIGSFLRYQSGELIRVPASNNNLLTQLGRGPANNPALWGGGTTFQNQVPGKPLLLKDPNCHCIDPTKDLVLNPAAWTDAPPGQFGTSAPYYTDYRWQRRPAESFSLGRDFVVERERNIKLQVRADFQNIFNRLFLASPIPISSGTFSVPLTGTNPAAPPTFQNGRLTSGYGYINWVNGGNTPGAPLNSGAQPRSGQIVARFTF